MLSRYDVEYCDRIWLHDLILIPEEESNAVRIGQQLTCRNVHPFLNFRRFICDSLSIKVDSRLSAGNRRDPELGSTTFSR